MGSAASSTVFNAISLLRGLMKNTVFPSVLLVALLTVASASAFATDTLYLPASTANPAVGDAWSDCYSDFGELFTAPTAGISCDITFPITLPVGHTIKQIAVIHHDNLVFPNASISAYLQGRQLAPPYQDYDAFFWDQVSPVPSGTRATDRMMAQSGKLYPDAFVVQMGFTYTIHMTVRNGAVIDGLQITYE